MKSVYALIVCILTAGCGEFEVRSIVLDLRVLAMTLDPPEVVIPFDLENLPDSPDDIDIGVEQIEICALVADPADSRTLEYNMAACARTSTLRCDETDRPIAPVARGTIEDPEESGEPVQVCGMLLNDLSLFSVLEDAVNEDSLSGFGGIEIIIDLAVFPTGGEFANAEWAAKRMIYAPRIPEERVANSNPSLEEIRVTRENGDEIVAPLGRCGDITPLNANLGEELVFDPIESEGSREDYVVPTFDGGSRMFTENHTYSWYSTFGEWEREVSGGARDVAGNSPPTDSTWTAPDDAAEVGDGLDARFWIVQRDERGGLTWYETCVNVTP